MSNDPDFERRINNQLATIAENQARFDERMAMISEQIVANNEQIAAMREAIAFIETWYGRT